MLNSGVSLVDQIGPQVGEIEPEKPVTRCIEQTIGFSQTPYINNQIKSNYFIVRLKVDQRAGQLISLPHLIGMTKTEK